jgi:hypothetical protein
MQKSLTVLLMLARLLGVVQLLVGIGIWFGVGTSTVTLHTALGGLFVLVVWIIAIIALFALPKRAVALVTLLWGALVLWFGMAQTTLLLGSAHWAVRVAHLLVGLAALGLVEALGGAAKRHWAVRGR